MNMEQIYEKFISCLYRESQVVLSEIKSNHSKFAKTIAIDWVESIQNKVKQLTGSTE